MFSDTPMLQPSEPPVHDEQIIKTICKVISGSEDYEVITACYDAICNIRRIVGRGY